MKYKSLSHSKSRGVYAQNKLWGILVLGDLQYYTTLILDESLQVTIMMIIYMLV